MFKEKIQRKFKDMKGKDPGELSSPGVGNSKNPLLADYGANERREKRRGRREKVSAVPGDVEPIVALRARALAILALVSSTSVNKRKEFMNRDFNAVINIR
jgi:hypothetical protein